VIGLRYNITYEYIEAKDLKKNKGRGIIQQKSNNRLPHKTKTPIINHPHKG
jgi:hypothetical protein